MAKEVKKILVIDDERSIRNTLSEILSFEGYEVIVAADGQVGLKNMENDQFDCIICDIKMPHLDGTEVFEQAQKICNQTPFVFITGHGTIELAVEAVKNGAFDFISKPPDLNKLLCTIRKAVDFKKEEPQPKPTPKKVKTIISNGGIMGHASVLEQTLAIVDKVAKTDARVLIFGENGSGKQLMAQRIHQGSQRADKDMVEVNCAAIPGELIESELFGHEKGSFTSAIKKRIGKFELANNSTLFLDEIGDMSLSAQAKVLRALEEKKITRVGGERAISVDVRVIAATNKDLLHEIEVGNFREDLYHRLSVIRVRVPALRERKEDIQLLSEHFLNIACQEYDIPVKTISKDAITILEKYEWPGNVRELKNAMERLAILGNEEISKEDVKTHVFSNAD